MKRSNVSKLIPLLKLINVVVFIGVFIHIRKFIIYHGISLLSIIVGLIMTFLEGFLLILTKIFDNEQSKFLTFCKKHKLFLSLVIATITLILLIPHTQTPQIYSIKVKQLHTSSTGDTLEYEVTVETNKTVNDVIIYVDDREESFPSHFIQTKNGRAFEGTIKLQQSQSDYKIYAGILYANDNIILCKNITETISQSKESNGFDSPNGKNELVEPSVSSPVDTSQDEGKVEAETVPSSDEVTTKAQSKQETESVSEDAKTENDSDLKMESEPEKTPETTTSNTELTVSVSYEKKLLSLTDVDAVIYATTSFNAEKVTLSCSTDAKFYGTWNMKSADRKKWEFEADFYEWGDFLITIKAYSSDGQVATNQLSILYPFDDIED